MSYNPPTVHMTSDDTVVERLYLCGADVQSPILPDRFTVTSDPDKVTCSICIGFLIERGI